MSKSEHTNSNEREPVIDHYASGYEADRLTKGAGRLELERTKELLLRFLPTPPATLLDIGGGTGVYACWLATLGYSAHLIDLVPVHIELAKEASALQPGAPLASAKVGDACSLECDSETVDAVLLLGPLYHLTERGDRMKALEEAYRVLKPGGVVFAVAISRFASVLDGLRLGYLKDPDFVQIVERDLKDGQHRNPTRKPGYFTDTFFHHPDELASEVSEAGFESSELFGIEGPSWLTPGIDDWWEDEAHKRQLLLAARRLESEPSLLGISAHLMCVARK